MPATAELDRLVERLHEDPEFRYSFSNDPHECLKGFDFSEDERELLKTRDQDAWFTFGFGGDGPRNHCVICVVVTLNLRDDKKDGD